MNKNVIYSVLMFVVTMSSGNASAQQLPYQNPALSAHERAVDLCGRLTLEEKASLMPVSYTHLTLPTICSV